MGAGYPLGSLVSESTFVGTGQPANTVVAIADIGIVPANFLQPGCIIEFELGLRVSLVNSATARTLRLALRMGGVNGAVLIDTTALALTVSTLMSGLPTIIRGHLTQRSAGASGQSSSAATMPNRFYSNAIDKGHPFPGPWALATYDTTVQQAVTLVAAESTNLVADQVQLESALLLGFKP